MNDITFKELDIFEDIHFFNEVRNSCAEKYLHDSRKFLIADTCKYLKETKNKYYIIYLDDHKIGYFRVSNHSEVNKNLYIGADLHEQYRGKGYAFIAYVKFICYLFDKYDLHKITLEVLDTNIRAKNLYNKLGFVYEGTKRCEVLKNNEYIDSIIYSIIRCEWEQKKHVI